MRSHPPGQIRGTCRTAEEVGHRMVSGMVDEAGRVVGPAYGVVVGRAVSSIQSRAGRGLICRTEAAAVQLDPLVGGEPREPCWAPETERCPQSSGLVGGAWPGNMCPPQGSHHRHYYFKKCS